MRAIIGENVAHLYCILAGGADGEIRCIDGRIHRRCIPGKLCQVCRGEGTTTWIVLKDGRPRVGEKVKLEAIMGSFVVTDVTMPVFGAADPFDDDFEMEFPSLMVNETQVMWWPAKGVLKLITLSDVQPGDRLAMLKECE